MILAPDINIQTYLLIYLLLLLLIIIKQQTLCSENCVNCKKKFSIQPVPKQCKFGGKSQRENGKEFDDEGPTTSVMRGS